VLRLRPLASMNRGHGEAFRRLVEKNGQEDQPAEHIRNNEPRTDGDSIKERMSLSATSTESPVR